MNKPNNKKPAPYCVFGAFEKADKALIGFRSQLTSGYELHICQCSKEHDFGDGGVVQNEDISGEYFTMYFCKRESLRAMIRVLQKLDDMWVDELLGKTCINTEDSVIQSAMKQLYKNMTPKAQKELMKTLNEGVDTLFSLDPDARKAIDDYLKGESNH